jgi:hypothetical protein
MRRRASDAWAAACCLPLAQNGSGTHTRRGLRPW